MMLLPVNSMREHGKSNEANKARPFQRQIAAMSCSVVLATMGNSHHKSRITTETTTVAMMIVPTVPCCRN